jgi:hypothetical protein
MVAFIYEIEIFLSTHIVSIDYRRGDGKKRAELRGDIDASIRYALTSSFRKP